MSDKVQEIVLDDIESEDPLAINNFIVSEPNAAPNPDYSIDQPFLFDGIVLGMCIKGSGVMKINFKEYAIEKNMLMAILPNNMFLVKEHSDDFIIETLFFSFDFISGLPIPDDLNIFFNMGASPLIKVKEKTMKELISYHTFILKQYYKDRIHYRVPIIRGLLYSLLMEIGSIYHSDHPYNRREDSSRQEELTEKFFALLVKNYKEERRVSFYAEKMFVTTKYLSLAIKNVTGYPVLKWINEVLITDIKTRLKISDHTVLQISEDLNFASPSFFCRYFKKNTGMTPMQYKNS